MHKELYCQKWSTAVLLNCLTTINTFSYFNTLTRIRVYQIIGLIHSLRKMMHFVVCSALVFLDHLISIVVSSGITDILAILFSCVVFTIV